MALTNRRGNLPIEKSFGVVGSTKVGMIRISSGTKNMNVHRRLLDMMVNLKELGRADLLIDLRDRKRTPLEVWKYYSTQSLGKIPPVAAKADLFSTLQEWVKTAKKRTGDDLRASTKRSYATNFRALRRGYLEEKEHGMSSAPIVEDLPTVLKIYRKYCVRKTHNTPFNQAKVACLAFARATQEDRQHSHLYIELSKIDPLSGKRKRPRNTLLRVYQIFEVMKKLEEPHSTHVFNFFITGMRIGEMAGDWEEKTDRVVIHGTKTENADRFVPRLAFIKRPRFARSTFVRKLREATKNSSLGVITPHDLRASYSAMLKQVGIPRNRVLYYFGHSDDNTLDDRYGTHNYEQYLEEDAKKLIQYIEENKEPPKTDAVSAVSEEEERRFVMHQFLEKMAAADDEFYDRYSGAPTPKGKLIDPHPSAKYRNLYKILLNENIPGEYVGPEEDLY